MTHLYLLGLLWSPERYKKIFNGITCIIFVHFKGWVCLEIRNIINQQTLIQFYVFFISV